MSIYKKVLAEDFDRLQPMLQRRYTLHADQVFQAQGVMRKIQCGKKWLYPFLLLSTKWNFLFPEQGHDIPFELINRVTVDLDGKEEVFWDRVFQFPKVTRHFQARMTIDQEIGRVKDYLGSPSLFYSDLFFRVSEQGELSIRSGKQRVVVGKVEIPIPKQLSAQVSVTEAFDEEKEAFTITVNISNHLIGTILRYEGEFRERKNP